MESVKKFIKSFVTVSAYTSGILIMCSVLFATINAIARKFFNISFPWAEELCLYFVVIGFYFVIPYLELKNEQLSINLLPLLAKNSMIRKIFYIFFGCLNIILFYILIKFGLHSTHIARLSGVTTHYMHIPKYFLYSIAIIALSISIVSWLAIIFLNKGEAFK